MGNPRNSWTLNPHVPWCSWISWVKVTHEIQEHWSPKNHDDSTVCASMHWIPIYMHQLPTDITKCVKYCSILQCNNLLQKKNLNRFENQGVNALCAQKLSVALVNYNTYCKKMIKVWVNIPQVQFVFNTWMWLALVINHCRDMNMKHIISIIIMFSYLHDLTKSFNCAQFINKKPNFLHANKSHASSMCHLFHTALDFHQEVVLQLHTLCILLKHISNQNGSNSNSDYSGLQVIYRNLSWPAVSQICSLTDFPPTFTTLLPNSTPMVWLESFLTEKQNQKNMYFPWWYFPSCLKVPGI